MHAPHCRFFWVGCEIDLRNDRLQSVCLEFVLAKSPRKKTPRVLSALQIDDKGALECGLTENHNSSPDTDIVSCAKMKQCLAARNNAKLSAG
jgi:hypothetical protein